MADNLPEKTNTNLESPSEYDSTSKAKFWKRNLKNIDFVQTYKRKGIAYKTLNKQTDLMFKNPFYTEDDQAITLLNDFKFNKYARYAYINALVSKYALIYKEYNDEGKYKDEAPKNVKANSYYVITRAWVERDIYDNQSKEIFDYYRIYQSDGSTFDLHKSRVIRVQPNEISKIEPAFDSIDVLDNVLWGAGQTMFRSGSGFPTLKVQNSVIKKKDGSTTSRIKEYKKSGFLNDINTQVGFIIDNKDDLDFKGAEGKAIKPMEYFDVAIQMCAIDLDVPVDVLKGVSAGAISGSETNLKEYYGDLSSKQPRHLNPIYDGFYESQLYLKPVEYKYPPIFEQTQKEIVDNLVKDSESLYKLEVRGYMTHEMVVKYFAREYPSLEYTEQNVNELKNQETYIATTPGFSFNSSSDKANDAKEPEATPMPKSQQRIESNYSKTMNKAFTDTSKNVTQLLQAFNT